MTTTNGTRKILDLKRWEMCSPSPVATAAATFIVSGRHWKQQQLYIVNATTAYVYYPYEDGWTQIASPALAGTFAAGACGTAVSVGPAGTASAGSNTTITTTLTLARDLRGYSIHITGGTNNKGVTTQILSNTIGSNAVITVADQGAAFDNTTTFRLLTPRFYVLNAITASGTTTANVFKFYDYALNTWTAAETGATDGVAPLAVIGTDGRLVATPSWMDGEYIQFATGTATAGGASTLTNSGKAWTTNQWANSQIRIVSGLGAGQIRTIASNTGTVITTSAAWTTNPDATSVYSIEGNDDFLYYTGSGGTAFYRYSISAGTWTAMATRTAPGVGVSAHWVWGVTESDWNVENTILNGRYIYSFRGAAGALIDRYDIAANSWTNGLAYAPAVETFTTGTKYVYVADAIYVQKEATGRWFRFDIPRSNMDGWGTMVYTQGAAALGDTAFDVTYHDGTVDIVFIHMVLNTSTAHLRQMVI